VVILLFIKDGRGSYYKNQNYSYFLLKGNFIMTDDMERILQLHQNWLMETEEPLDRLRADFTGQDLHGIDFSGRDLSLAIFKGANLEGANFFNAKLVGANFEGANLTKASFTNANLTAANIKNANTSDTIFNNAQLYGVIE